MHLLVLLVENEWGWKNHLKQSPGAQATLKDLGFCKDCCVQAQFDAELACMLWNSK